MVVVVVVRGSDFNGAVRKRNEPKRSEAQSARRDARATDSFDVFKQTIEFSKITTPFAQRAVNQKLQKKKEFFFLLASKPSNRSSDLFQLLLLH